MLLYNYLDAALEAVLFPFFCVCHSDIIAYCTVKYIYIFFTILVCETNAIKWYGVLGRGCALSCSQREGHFSSQCESAVLLSSVP